MTAVNLADIVLSVSLRNPVRPAIRSPKLTLTYGEFAARISRSAAELRERGVRMGDRVGIALRDNGEAMTVLMALWMLRATAVLIDFRAKPAERADLVADFQLKAIVEDRSFTAAAYPSIVAGPDWGDLIARHDGAPIYGAGSAPAVIQLSSGTTGKPTGALLGHERLLLRVLFPLEIAPRNAGGPAVTAIPLSFSMSLHFCLNRILDGAELCFLPPISGHGEFADAILASGATSACLVPTILRGLLELYESAPAPAFAGLETLYCAGAPTRPDEKRLAKAVLSPHFFESYASNISGRVSFLHGADVDARAETVGRVLPQVTVQIVDADDRPLPVGRSGLIRVRGPGMADAVCGAPPSVANDMMRDGWVYPGDVGAVDQHGFLELHGRRSDVINRSGVKVYPAEIEQALCELENVRDAAVIGFPSAREGEDIAAFVVGDGLDDIAALEGHCRKRLTAEKRPRRIIVLPDLPRNANGKVVRTALRDILQETTEPG